MSAFTWEKLHKFKLSRALTISVHRAIISSVDKIKASRHLKNLQKFWKFLTIKTTICTKISQIYSWNETLHVSASSSVHHQEFFTVHTATVYVIQADPARKAVSKPAWHTPLLCVQWKTPDDGQRNCPNHVEFHSKINLRN